MSIFFFISWKGSLLLLSITWRAVVLNKSFVFFTVMEYFTFNSFKLLIAILKLTEYKSIIFFKLFFLSSLSWNWFNTVFCELKTLSNPPLIKAFMKQLSHIILFFLSWFIAFLLIISTNNFTKFSSLICFEIKLIIFSLGVELSYSNASYAGILLQYLHTFLISIFSSLSDLILLFPIKVFIDSFLVLVLRISLFCGSSSLFSLFSLVDIIFWLIFIINIFN